MRALNNKETLPRVIDPWLVLVMIAILVLGIVMVSSASITIASSAPYNDLFYFVRRQAIAIAVGLFAACLVWQAPLHWFEKGANALFVVAVILLGLVLINGIGREVNGAHRWIGAGGFNLQVSELAKWLAIVYYARYLTLHGAEVQESLKAFLFSLIPLGVVAALMLAEPDLGATAVMVTAVFGMYFIFGVRLSHFGLLFGTVLAGFVAMIVFAPWRLARLLSFSHACDPEYAQDQGYQLCQALIAFSRGEWFGVGLGSSVQKLFYLPEAHTDFLLAVLGEELGLFGSLMVVVLFSMLVLRVVRIAHQAEQERYQFGALYAYGVAFWIGVQAFVNVAVNMGLLPTKGLTLPLMSYGGSSIVVTAVALAMVMRVQRETQGRRLGTGVNHRIWAVAS